MAVQSMESIPITRLRGQYTEIVAWTKTDGVFADVTGHTYKFYIIDSDGVAVVTKSTGSGITQDATGEVVISLNSADTKAATLPDTEYKYQLWLFEQSTNRPYPQAEGKFLLEESPV